MNDSTKDKTNPQNIVKISPATGDSLQYTIPQSGDKMKRFAVSCIDFENNESELSFWP